MFRENPELMDAYVWVYFHSSTPKYNRIECWGPLKDAAKVWSNSRWLGLLFVLFMEMWNLCVFLVVKGKQQGNHQGFLSSTTSRKLIRHKSIFHTLFTFLLWDKVVHSPVFFFANDVDFLMSIWHKCNLPTFKCSYLGNLWEPSFLYASSILVVL